MSSEELARLRRRAERERAARKEAERIAEEKTRDLYLANQRLTELTGNLEAAIAARTAELEEANQRLKAENAERLAAEEARERNLEETRRTLARVEALYRASRALQYGMVAVNRTKVTGAPIPFGGMKQSGVGREGARLGMAAFMDVKYVCRDWA